MTGLRGEGMTIVTVSMVSSLQPVCPTVRMLFHGEMTGVGEIHDFFRGNYFFTTAANRIAKAWFPDAITCEEVLEQWEKADRAEGGGTAVGLDEGREGQTVDQMKDEEKL